MLAQRPGAKAVMASLLRNAQPGAGKAEALRQAQLALLRGGTETPAGGVEQRGIQMGLPQAKSGAARTPYSHPFFWAPFILIGNWR